MSESKPQENPSPHEHELKSPLKLLIWIFLVPAAMLILSALTD